jgi:ABC-type nitrate/sulfonate/bicarbonate transport system substrate-binding protein
MPYLANAGRGEDLVMYGLDGTLQIINSLYVLTSSDYHSVQDLVGERIGVWSFGSSTVQSFQALLADRTGLRLREDFETTTAAPPALVGLLQDGEVDGIIDISGISIAMESQPDTFRNIAQLNQWWIDRTGFTLPLTGWFAYADWYEDNTDVAAGLIRGARRAVDNFRDNTVSILEEFGEPAGIDNQAKIDVVERWANAGQVYHGEQTSEYLEATWEFVQLMSDQGFIEQVPEQSSVLRNPLE